MLAVETTASRLRASVCVDPLRPPDLSGVDRWHEVNAGKGLRMAETSETRSPIDAGALISAETEQVDFAIQEINL
jgi:hypothetical protein